MSLGINEYQVKAHEFARYGAENKLYSVLALGEEAGEVQGKFAKIMRDKNNTMNDEDIIAIKKELGDVAWNLAEISTVLGLSLEDVMQSNLDKLTDRKNRNVISGSGDNR